MAGIYGQINSRADFQRVLAQALDTARRGLASAPNSYVTQIAARQLEAMQAWTANGRTPSADEQNRIDVSVLAGRELRDTGRSETEEWVQQLTDLDNYFQAWPTDREAASSTGSASEALALLEKIRNRKTKANKNPAP
jgi:hypothetical protein